MFSDGQKRVKGSTTALVLAAVATACYSGIRLGYFRGVIDSQSHGNLMAYLFIGSLCLGVVAAVLAGFAGSHVLVGVLVGTAPGLGLVVGSILTVSLGMGTFDSSITVLGGMVTAGFAICGVVAWAVGAIADGGGAVP